MSKRRAEHQLTDRDDPDAVSDDVSSHAFDTVSMLSSVFLIVFTE